MAQRNVVAVLVAVAVAAVGAAGLANAGSGTASQDQCSLPLSERTGGWFCPGPSAGP